MALSTRRICAYQLYATAKFRTSPEPASGMCAARCLADGLRPPDSPPSWQWLFGSRLFPALPSTRSKPSRQGEYLLLGIPSLVPWYPAESLTGGRRVRGGQRPTGRDRRMMSPPGWLAPGTGRIYSRPFPRNTPHRHSRAPAAMRKIRLPSPAHEAALDRAV